MTNRDRRPQDDPRFRSLMQPVPLSPPQRRRHRELLARASEGEDMEWLRRRGRTELAVVVLALILVAAGAVIWNSLLDEAGEPDDGLLDVAQATLTSRAGQPASTSTLETTAAQAAASADPGGCQVDGYAQNLPAGLPYSSDDPFEEWYGSKEGGLWASPANRAKYRPGLDYEPNRWFAGEETPVMWYGSDVPIEISARREGGEEIELSGEVVSLSSTIRTQWTSFEIPTPGCWEISGRGGDKSLSITVEVLPIEQRQDYVFLSELAAIRPFEIPADCPVSPHSGPAARAGNFIATYWLEDDGLGIDMDQAWLVANRDEPVHLIHDPGSGAITIHAASRDDLSQSFDAGVNPMNTDGTASYGYLTFPSAGCWDIEIQTAVRTATFTVYVYPPACAPVLETLTVPAACRPPEG